MQLETYICFDRGCDEAIAFYRDALGAGVSMLLRFNDAPKPSMTLPGTVQKIIHANPRIGDATVLVSDGRRTGRATLQGFSPVITSADKRKRETTWWSR